MRIFPLFCALWTVGHCSDECSKLSTGLHPLQPPRCSPAYLHCDNGATYQRVCPGELYFNPVTKACDYFGAVQLCRDSDSDDLEYLPCPRNGAYSLPNQYCSNEFYVCKDGDAKRKYCPGTHIYDPLEAKCRPLQHIETCEFNCELAEEGAPIEKKNNPHSIGCSRYYWWCYNGHATKHACPEGSYFNEDDGKCAFFREVRKCTKEEVVTTPQTVRLPPDLFDCSKVDEGQYAYTPTSCLSDFVTCAHGTAFATRCVNELKFNPVTKNCDFDANVRACQEPQPDTTFPAVRTSDQCVVLGVLAASAQPQCSPLYYSCVQLNMGPVVNRCIADMLYNPNTQSCDTLTMIPECFLTTTTTAATTTTVRDSTAYPTTQRDPFTRAAITTTTEPATINPATISCGVNEAFQICGSLCTLSCLTLHQSRGTCTLGCAPGCFCTRGYIRAPDGRCVRPSQCPSVGDTFTVEPQTSVVTCLGRHEEFQSCGSACAVRKCSDLGQAIQACTEHCMVGCACQAGYIRDQQGMCIQPQQCEEYCRNRSNGFYPLGACQREYIMCFDQNRVDMRCHDPLHLFDHRQFVCKPKAQLSTRC